MMSACRKEEGGSWEGREGGDAVFLFPLLVGEKRRRE